MSALDRTRNMFMDTADVMEFTGKGKTFASYVLHSIAEVCGSYDFGVRDPLIAYEDYLWWIKNMGGLKMDWKHKCLQDMDTAQRLWSNKQYGSDESHAENALKQNKWVK